MIAAKSKASAPVPGKLDRGIRKVVERLQACGIETFESCEGGEGHAFLEPTIRFYGTPEAGWRAVAACLVQWKTQLLDGAMGVFLSPAEKRESQGPSVKDMQAKIGQLALENDFLAGALGRIDGASAKK
jgi:hypothetical protein